MSSQKHVFVTGAGRGIGQTLALKLAQENYIVSGCSRTLSELENTKSLSSGKVRVTALDVTDEGAVKKWITTEIAATKATPWGLVTAAGILGPVGLFSETPWEEWQRAIEINIFGTAFITKCFVELLKTNDLPGRIILFSGGGATKPQPRLTSYGASKSAVVRFGETLAHELKEFKITVNSVAPGAVNTQFTEEIIKAGPSKAGQKSYDEAIKQKQTGGTSPEKPSALCSYLLSEKAVSVTGRLISAVWDPWDTLHERDSLEESDIYTLRRIVPEDRKMDWSQK